MKTSILPRFFYTPEKTLDLIFLIGFFILLAGKILIPTSSGYGTQIYLWLLLPTLILFVKNKPHLLDVNLKVIAPLILFLIWYAISAFWSDNEKSLSKYYKYAIYLTIFSLAFVSYKNNTKVFLKAARISVITISIICLISLVYISFTTENIIFRAYRIQAFPFDNLGGFTHPIIFGNYLGIIASTTLTISLYESNKKQRFIYYSCYILILAMISLTGSRGPILAHLITALTLILLKFKRLLIPLLVTATAFAASLLYVTSDITNQILHQDNSIYEVLNSILTYRPVTWVQALELFLQSPIIGHGAEAHFYAYIPQLDFDATHPHNGFILIAYETGIIGLLLFLITMSTTSFSLIKNYSTTEEARIGFSLMVFSLAAMLTDVHKIVCAPHAYWIMLWLPCSIAMSQSKPEINS